ncbi:MAG: SURF1 family protein, partial [Pseudomonadota bacterium]
MTRPAANHRPWWVDACLIVLSAALLVGFVLLGNWQIQRLSWKLDLIEAVDSRAFADPVAPPEGQVTQDGHAYLRIALRGQFQHDLSITVKAVTDLGPGYWVMTPLLSGNRYYWINRGFVPTDKREPDHWTTPSGEIDVVGLLRITEPGGTLLERNDPSANRWYSRDVVALSADVGLAQSATYFIDAEHDGEPASWPRGGLTKVTFRNPHLTYAMTWYAMALLFLAGLVYVVRDRILASRFLPDQPMAR